MTAVPIAVDVPLGALAAQNDLKMQVSAVHITSHTNVADDFALFDLLADLYAIAGQVGVPCLQGHALVGRVLDSHHVTVTLHPCFCLAVPVLRLVNCAVLCRVDWALVIRAVLRAPVSGLIQATVIVVSALR